MESKEIKQQKSRKRRKHKKHRRSKPVSNHQVNSSVSSSIGMGLSQLSSDTDKHFLHVGLDLPVNSRTQCSWFWENYHQAMGWQRRHQVAYWRSRALASEHQNRLLLDYVENNTDREVMIQCQQPEDMDKSYKQRVDYHRSRPIVDTASDSESFVFEVNEEMLLFLEQSMKHKTELRKQREEERQSEMDNLNSVSAGPLLSTLSVGRFEVAEKTSLYGKNATTIIALETSMQLAFERYLDEKKPKLWPNIALNL